MSEKEKNLKVEEVVTSLEDLFRASRDLDRLLTEAVGSGFDTGRLSGILEVHDFLISRGHSLAAKALRELVKDETIFMKSKGSA